ncbi:hypothetical protein PBY51_001316 [Eleginops maclovinus]|uniref:Uncharacterized protein n=1 Tax=Eleginops maclovinus TaxID=56733 RepID=A0AAN7X082_ELEMC|nr:hypothetical protein PBY51_001316 [Eleginops maclovinus]
MIRKGREAVLTASSFRTPADQCPRTADAFIPYSGEEIGCDASCSMVQSVPFASLRGTADRAGSSLQEVTRLNCNSFRKLP